MSYPDVLTWDHLRRLDQLSNMSEIFDLVLVVGELKYKYSGNDANYIMETVSPPTLFVILPWTFPKDGVWHNWYKFGMHLGKYIDSTVKLKVDSNLNINIVQCFNGFQNVMSLDVFSHDIMANPGPVLLLRHNWSQGIVTRPVVSFEEIQVWLSRNSRTSA